MVDSSTRNARRMSTRAALVGVLLLGACASQQVAQCRSGDWYAVGYRDGDVYGIRPQIDLYSHRCGSVDAPAQAAYMAGWTDGYAEWNARVQKTESP